MNKERKKETNEWNEMKNGFYFQKSCTKQQTSLPSQGYEHVNQCVFYLFIHLFNFIYILSHWKIKPVKVNMVKVKPVKFNFKFNFNSK